MARFVIEVDVALYLAEGRVKVAHSLLAPTLLRSEVLARLYAQVRAGDLTRREAEARLTHLRGLGIRYLGDRVLQGRAWDIAAELGWEDTLRAEYLALTQLQADALVTLDAGLADQVAGLVSVVGVAALAAV